MTEPSTSQQGVVLRERSGWGAPVALTLVAAMCSVAHPGLLLLVPLALLLIAAPPRRPVLVLLGGVLLVLGLTGQASDVLWWFGRGWALMLGALFLVITVLRPETSFLDRALTSVFGTVIGAAGLLAARSGWSSLDLSVAQKLRDSSSAVEAQLAARNLSSRFLESMRQAADLQALIFPALLGIASLAALGVTWWVWRRVTVHDANPLSSLAEFRFRDELVWLVVVAVLLIVLPLGENALRAGTNLATFMGALYALRGVAILIALFPVSSPLGVLAGLVVFLAFFPIVIASTVVLGLTDTWMDLRSRARPIRPRPPK